MNIWQILGNTKLLPTSTAVVFVSHLFHLLVCRMEDPAPGTRHSPGSGSWTLLLQGGAGNQRAAAAAWSQPIDVLWETAFPMAGWLWIPMNWDGLP